LDFLFTYYSHRPGHLERWQPGPGFILAGRDAERFLSRRGYRKTEGGITLDDGDFSEKQLRTTKFILSLLDKTASRTARLNCFGLHEWAMVYQAPDQLRHPQLNLRLDPADTDSVVESLPIRCSHYDAFRFFTTPARPLNTLSPDLYTRAEFEQPGCLHATMDLFKWAYKLDPYIASELMGDCFALAVEVRTMDMRASPYDLAEAGYSPIKIETPEGRAEYAKAQGDFARKAQPLRERLISHCRELLDRYGHLGQTTSSQSDT
jgi:hypothetical protein